LNLQDWPTNPHPLSTQRHEKQRAKVVAYHFMGVASASHRHRYESIEFPAQFLAFLPRQERFDRYRLPQYGASISTIA
jgi:hypothetical protein